MNTDNEQNLIYGDILVVEDDTSNLKFLMNSLTEIGYQVRPASDGELALRSVQARLPELILLDYKMPGMNGIEVCRYLKEDLQTKDIPVIFLSGLEETDLKVKALEAGAIDYITKPIELSELLGRIENHLKLFRLQKELILQSKELRQEIEDRKQAEEGLKHSLEREQVLADIVRNAPVAIAYGYPDGRLANCNEAFSDLTGYSSEEMHDVYWNRTLTPEKWLESEAEKLKQLSFTNNSVSYEKEYIRKNGTVVPVELVVTAKFDSEQKLIHYVGFVTDISQRKKMGKQILQNEKMATVAGLAAGVAHELNTPLSAILQAHQLVEMGLSPVEERSREKAAECNVDLAAVQGYLKKNDLDYFMNGIRESALKADNIIKSLMEFSRPNEGEFSTADIEDIMESALLLSQSDYDMKKKYNIMNVRFMKEYDSDLSSLVCVATEIEQVVLGLIKNSVQAMMATDLTEKPCITLRTAAAGNRAVIEVEDNGPGIPGEVKQHIFDPFFTTREVGIGTGLGLAVVYTVVVEKHGGTIEVESEPGEGAKFIIKLPLNQAG